MMEKQPGIVMDELHRNAVQILLEYFQTKMLSGNMEMPQTPEAAAENEIEELLDIPYINRNGVPLSMNIFKPKDSQEKDLPVIVTIHGGGLVMGDRRISCNFSGILADNGFIVFR